MEAPQTLLEAIQYFSDPDKARDFVVELRWPNGVACPRMGCGNADVQWISTRKLWRCKECKRQFTAKVGTIFEDSPIGFDKWLPAFWLLSSNRNGISSCELARAIGVTQKTAWFMLHRVRLAMQTQTLEPLRGYVEADETYLGGKIRNPAPGKQGRRARGPKTAKTAVMGMIERGGNVRAFVIPDDKSETLLTEVVKHVGPGSRVFTDAHPSYYWLSKSYAHSVINHAKEYVRGDIHTNSIENFWSVLKRTLSGTYICAREKHMNAYLDEQVFRFNSRESTDGPRFATALRGADGKRLTYRHLTSNGKIVDR